MGWKVGWLSGLVTLALSTAPLLRAQDAGLASGAQQVKEGDYEAAVVTLDAAARRLEAQAGQQRNAAQARLLLGVARVALGEPDAALLEFRAALRLDPTLRVAEDQYSPKVVRVFEMARRDLPTPSPGRGKSSKAPLLVLGGLGAAGAAVALAAGGGSSPSPGSVSFTNAHFSAPVILCPNGSVGAPLPFTVVVDVRNGTGLPVAVRSANVRMTIVASPEVPSEVGQSADGPGVPIPSSVPARTELSMQVQSSLLCSNQPGGVVRFNDWKALVTLETSAGAFNLETSELLRVNLP